MSKGMNISNKFFVTQGGYNFYRLTGKFWESVSTQSGTGVVNLFNHQYDGFTLEFLGIRKEQMGKLVTYRDVSPLSNEGARILGVRSGIPVVPAHPDGALNQIGNYANWPGIMTLSIGTSGALRVVAEEPVLPKQQNAAATVLAFPNLPNPHRYPTVFSAVTAHNNRAHIPVTDRNMLLYHLYCSPEYFLI